METKQYSINEINPWYVTCCPNVYSLFQFHFLFGWTAFLKLPNWTVSRPFVWVPGPTVFVTMYLCVDVFSIYDRFTGAWLSMAMHGYASFTKITLYNSKTNWLQRNSLSSLRSNMVPSFRNQRRQFLCGQKRWVGFFCVYRVAGFDFLFRKHPNSWSQLQLFPEPCGNPMLLEPPRNAGSQKLVFPSVQNLGTIQALVARSHGPAFQDCRNILREPWDPIILTPPNLKELARTHCSRNLAQTLVRGTLGSVNLAWILSPETVVPETGKTRGAPVCGTLGSRNLAANPSFRNPWCPEPSDHPEGYVGWHPEAFCCGEKVAFIVACW